MPEQVSDEQIAFTVRQAEEMIRKLDLTDVERAWAKEQAKLLFKSVTDALFERMRAGEPLRGIAASAAMAYALTVGKDFGAAMDKLR